MEQDSVSETKVAEPRKKGLMTLGIAILGALVAVIALQIVILARTNKAGEMYRSLQAPAGAPASNADVRALNSMSQCPAIRSCDDEWAMRTEMALRDASRMFDDMNSIFGHTFRNFAVPDPFAYFDQGWESLGATSAIDMREEGGNYVVVITMPPEAPTSKVSVQLDGRILNISSVSQRRERGGSATETFETRIQIPGAVGDIQQARALITNGTLRILVPKGVGREDKRQGKILL